MKRRGSAPRVTTLGRNPTEASRIRDGMAIARACIETTTYRCPYRMENLARMDPIDRLSWMKEGPPSY